MTDENSTFPNGKPPRSIAHPAMQQIVQGAEYATKTARVKLALRPRLSGRSVLEVHIDEAMINFSPRQASKLADAIEDNLYQRIGYGTYNAYGRNTTQPLSVAPMSRGGRRCVYLRLNSSEVLLETPHATLLIQKLRQLSDDAIRRPGAFLRAFLVDDCEFQPAQAN